MRTRARHSLFAIVIATMVVSNVGRLDGVGAEDVIRHRTGLLWRDGWNILPNESELVAPHFTCDIVVG